MALLPLFFLANAGDVGNLMMSMCKTNTQSTRLGRGAILAFLCIAGLLCPALSFASVIYVDSSNTAFTTDGTQLNPHRTIAEGVLVAVDGDLVDVAAGIYRETVEMRSGIRLN